MKKDNNNLLNWQELIGRWDGVPAKRASIIEDKLETYPKTLYSRTDGWAGQTLKGDGHDSVFLNYRLVHGHRLRR